MNSGKTDCQRISRRVVFTGTVLALGAAAAATVVSEATAQKKFSQSQAKYRVLLEGRSALRRLHPLPTAEHVQSRTR